MHSQLSYKQYRQLILMVSAFIIILLPFSFAAPIETILKENQDQSDMEAYFLRHFSKSVVDAFKVLKTILLAYLAHAMTIRPDSSTTLLPNMYKRLSALAWPTSGVYESFGAIVKIRHSDRIFGFNNLTVPPKLLPERSVNETFLQSEDWGSPNVPLLIDEKDLTPEEVDNGVENVEMKKHDNLEYLRNRFHSMEDDKIKRVKNCILNGSLYLGTNTLLISKDGTKLRLESSDMTICGPGASCKYQLPVHPSYVRYLTKPMIDQLELSHGIQNNAYFTTFIALVQLFYTVYECIQGTGQKWSKVLMIIFMTMSVLQLVSVYVLPTQVVAYSIKGVAEFNDPYRYLEKRKLEHSHPLASFLLHMFPNRAKKIFTDRECIIYDVLYKTGMKPAFVKAVISNPTGANITIAVQNPGRWEGAVIFGSTVAWLMLGFWPGFMAGTITEILVLVWILVGVPFHILRIFLFDPSYLIGWKLYLVLTIVLLVPGMGLVLSATVYGYIFGTPIEIS
ncbi:hypothetical protein PHYBLDRAFT_163880 [Phycomyces blakesleeanus NRRL 1555(-)]|uniref:Uncharacterized protein n=3 Tax=Phycomyces blakesleeanus TaxID=4837 RepID=A0A167PYZ5_PHYB8|nr:hypothetical protein PHYBLDRAFT_163880 [Phycomyces blakesleeanus NRRL 1555(-)]OAD78789.1 hypothetical protein PHYBLDRAFT_163880 [Phycomyces blakesleeanus NRRL 1555(-)]|eukprot:XP_018296829.1 hypothetical protein PHYBLDRAFT_163880 [Phycomyces blakesleeanus NRRL 1555(-)]